MFFHLWFWKVSNVILTVGIDSQKISLFFCRSLSSLKLIVNALQIVTYFTVWDFNMKLIGYYLLSWIKAKHQMRCRIWQKSKSVIWITVSFANWSINKLPISDLIYKLFSRGRGSSKIFGTTNNFGVNTWRVLFPWHLPGSDTFTFTGSDTFLAYYRTFNLWL